MTPREAAEAQDKCPLAREHTPAPEGYMHRISWAERMRQKHKQLRCPGCGLWKIWVRVKI